MAMSEFPMTATTGLAAATATSISFPRDASLAKAEVDGLATVPALEIEEETLVIDDRSGLSPAQMVESKLSRKLRETSLPVSHLQMRVLLRTR